MVSPNFSDFLRRGRGNIQQYKLILLKLVDLEAAGESLTELAKEDWRVRTFCDNGVTLLERFVDEPTDEEKPE